MVENETRPYWSVTCTACRCYSLSMQWIVLTAALALLGVGLWFLISLALMLRDYDDLDWGDDEF